MSGREVVAAPAQRADAVQSFDGGIPRDENGKPLEGDGTRRLRLTGVEARLVRYCLCEWDGDAGAGSSMGVQLEKLAQRPDLAPRHTKEDYAEVWEWSNRHRDAQPSMASMDSPIGNSWQKAWLDDQQHIYVHAPVPMARPDQVLPQEQWADKSTGNQRFRRSEGHPNWVRSDRDERLPGECDKILRAYRALLALGREKPTAYAVIASLYGDLPPGLPGVLWVKAGGTDAPSTEDLEYRRVCKYVPGTAGSALHFEQMIQIDRRQRKGESPEARLARVQAETVARHGALIAVGKACEILIVGSSLDYRAAWRAAA